MHSLRLNKSSKINRVACFMAVLILMLMNLGDVHSHSCLDGQEPAVSYHFENLDGHPDHSNEEQIHNDYEYELSIDTLQAKSSGSSDFFLVSLFPHSFSVVSTQLYFIPTPVESFILNEPAAYLPPLRAPPVTA
jgi:hypothetical protein